MTTQHRERLERARAALEGLSVGDALGGHFELGRSPLTNFYVQSRKLPSPPWHFTDDTNMALSIYAVLRRHEHIDQDALAADFAKRFEPTRGYGMGARHLLTRILAGENWRDLVTHMFGGEGSFGNGGAMRVAPLGAYFADDLDAAITNAQRSAEVTHAHPEGIAGTIAVAVAAAVAWQTRDESLTRANFIERVLPHIPDSAVRTGAVSARDLPTGTSVEDAVAALGNGSRIAAQDTVPFVLWCAGEQLDHYEEAVWLTMRGGGDVDTTCAMVGGIVALSSGLDSIPDEWVKHREPLPTWAFEG